MEVMVATVALPATHDRATNLKNMLAYLDEAADADADLVVFPETSVQGYPADLPNRDVEPELQRVYETAEKVPDGPGVVAIAERSIERGVHVVYGLTEAGDRMGIVYNTAVLTGPDGHIGQFRKVHLPASEQLYWQPGNEWPVYDTPLGRIGMMICWDKAWPESARELTLRGADLLVVPSAWGRTPAHGKRMGDLSARLYELYDRARAAENCRWLVSANVVGELGGLEFIGMSAIVDPLGEVLEQTRYGECGVAHRTIDVERGIADARAATLGGFRVSDWRAERYPMLRGLRYEGQAGSGGATQT